MSRTRVLCTLAVLALALTAACGNPAGPDATSLTGISPAPAATGVAITTPLTLTFSRPMMPGMEQYVDLHQGGVGGLLVPMTCDWNAEQTTLTCTPAMPLSPATQYTVHMGGGMSDENGRKMTMENWTAMGAQWATGGMMGGTHAGQPVSMMAPGWRHGSGDYGMLFGFTTG